MILDCELYDGGDDRGVDDSDDDDDSAQIRNFSCTVVFTLLVCALLTALSIPYSQTTWNSVPGFVCMYVCMSACFFKMLLLRHFLSD